MSFPSTRISTRTTFIGARPISRRHRLEAAFAAASTTRRQHRRQATTTLPGKGAVATSEHWWEDEEEFDSLTDALMPKLLVLAAAPGAGQSAEQGPALRDFLRPASFVCGFCGMEEAALAETLWEGRARAPLFLKMRKRAALDGGAAAPVDDFLAEVLQQNWRLELDAGLGVAGPAAEAILVVCSAEAVEKLLQHCLGSGHGEGGSVAAGTVSVVSVGGTTAGDSAVWSALDKSAGSIGVVPVPGGSLKLAAS